jgi:hypothetical protein
MEDHMPESTTSAGDAAPPVSEDQAIRQRVKGLTSQVLQEGRFDPDAVRDVVRAMIGEYRAMRLLTPESCSPKR